MNVWLTAAFVLLMATLMVPIKLTPGIETATLPETVPARPAVVVIKSA